MALTPYMAFLLTIEIFIFFFNDIFGASYRMVVTKVVTTSFSTLRLSRSSRFTSFLIHRTLIKMRFRLERKKGHWYPAGPKYQHEVVKKGPVRLCEQFKPDIDFWPSDLPGISPCAGGMCCWAQFSERVRA